LSGLWRLFDEVGTPIAYIASGTLFGGFGLFGVWYGVTEGYSCDLFLLSGDRSRLVLPTARTPSRPASASSYNSRQWVS